LLKVSEAAFTVKQGFLKCLAARDYPRDRILSLEMTEASVRMEEGQSTRLGNSNKLPLDLRVFPDED